MDLKAKALICRHLEGYEGNINSNAQYIISLLAEQVSTEELISTLRDTLRGKDPQIFIDWLISFISKLESNSDPNVVLLQEEALLANQQQQQQHQQQQQPIQQRPPRQQRQQNITITRGGRRNDQREITITRDSFDSGDRKRRNGGGNNNRVDPHEQLCPRDPHCDQEGCPFKHTVLPIHNVKCRFDPKCTNTKCPFKHEVPPEIVLKLQRQDEIINRLTKLINIPAAAAAQNAASAPPCRNGFACPGRADKSCHFSHPKIKCAHRDDASCKFGAACRYSHAKDCTFGANCKKPGCTFAHPGAADFEGADATMAVTSATSDVMSAGSAPYVDPLAPVLGAAMATMPAASVNNDVTTSDAVAAGDGSGDKKMCPMGENCMDAECPYEHPNSSKSGVSYV